MSEIETLAEGGAFMDAADTILGLNHPMRDVEIARLRAAWIAGRDWQHAESERTIAALTSALDRSTAIVESMAAWLNDSGETCNRGNPDGGGIYPCDHCTIEEMMREAHAATEQAEPLLLAAIAAGSPDDRGED